MGEKIAYDVIEKAKKLNYDYAVAFMFSVLRTSLINHNRLDKLCELFSVRYPGELTALVDENPLMYFRIKAIIFECNKQTDSAMACLDAAEQLLPEQGNANSRSNFFKRKGEFYLRTARIESDHTKEKKTNSIAIKAFEAAVDYAVKASNFELIMQSAALLDSIYYTTGNTDKAYCYAKLYQKYSDSNHHMLDKNHYTLLEINNKENMQAMALEKERQFEERQHNLQTLFLALCIALAFIVLVFLTNSTVSVWVVKLYGYLTFVFFFEFIVHIADSFIHHITHGHLVWVMAFKVALISILLPIHHWSEHKTLDYLMNHKLLREGKFSFRNLGSSLSPVGKKPGRKTR